MSGWYERGRTVLDMTKAARNRRELVRAFAWILLACLVVGAVMGVAWASISPRVQLTVKQGELVYAEGTEAAVAGDLSFACLAVTVGLLTGIVVATRRKLVRTGALLGVVAGGLLGSLVAWKVGLAVANGADQDIELSAAGHGEGVVFSGPLSIDAPGVLLLWSLSAIVVLTYVSWLRKRKATRAIDDVLRDAQLEPSVGA